ncbi:MAG: EI24 domain-containing protein [Planctomycetota bacterium]|nr:EI24 domain-containing protein [Planctomycetota bacterium]
MSDLAPDQRCGCCGYFGPLAAGCQRCGGTAQTLTDAPLPLEPGRGLPPLDFLRGLRTFGRATGQLMHHRAFVGQLKLPVMANLLAFASLAAFALLVLLPEFRAWFAGTWPVLDGFRAANEGGGPMRLMLVTVGLLWPIWFDVLAGPIAEPLVRTTEGVVGGPAMAATPATRAERSNVSRVRDRARLFALEVLTLPLVWLLVMLPWIGLPLGVLLISAAAAVIWCETPAARRGLGLRQHLQDLRHNWPRALGFGLGCQLGLAVLPVGMLLLTPSAVVGATVLHFTFDKPQAAPANGTSKALSAQS